MLRAVIFDFDGLMLDTEGSDFLSWQEMFASHGATLLLSTWLPHVGIGRTTNAANAFNPYDHLEQQIGYPLDRERIRVQRKQRHEAIVADLKLLPGVLETIQAARQRGLLLGVASSSVRAWVVRYLEQHALLPYFDCIVCGDEVEHTKPYPDIYQAVLTQLAITADQAIALEDSPNGVRGAKAAGIYCIAIPGPMTRQQSFEHADLRLDSLLDLSLDTFLSSEPH